MSFGDTYMRRGYYKPPHTYPTHLPYIPGIDGVGTIAEIGANVEGPEVGDVVTYVLGHHSYAQFVNVPAWKVIRISAGTSAEMACALMINGMTAYYLTHLLFPLGPQHTCLVHAGAGSVGQLVIQLARRRGARVMTTVGTPEKERIARDLGVDTVIRYREVDFVEAVRAATGGKGVDVVYESLVGLETYRRSMKCLEAARDMSALWRRVWDFGLRPADGGSCGERLDLRDAVPSGALHHQCGRGPSCCRLIVRPTSQGRPHDCD